MTTQEKLTFIVNAEDVTDDLILKRCKTFKDALKLCRDCSPLGDDEILFELEKRAGRKIQRSHFSESLSSHGDRNFPPELIQTLEDICENLIPTRFMALSRNQELRPMKEALELENEALRGELKKKTEEFEAIKEFLRDARVIK